MLWSPIQSLLKKFASGLATPSSPRVGLRDEPRSLSASTKVSEVRGWIDEAQNGNMRNYFTYCRDVLFGNGHVHAEFSKRLLAVLGDAIRVMPEDKSKPEDVRAAAGVTQMIKDCENWTEGLTWLLASSLLPVRIVQKVWRARDASEVGESLRYTLKRFDTIDDQLLCFEQRPIGQSVNSPRPQIGGEGQGEGAQSGDVPEPELWEPTIRLYPVDATGRINFSYTEAQPLDPNIHMVHRGHLMKGFRDTLGGPMRAILFWSLFATLGRGWFARTQERYGVPFVVVKTDTTIKQITDAIKDALATASKVFGITVPHETEIEIDEINYSGAADAQEKFITLCHREISKVIIGHTLSSEAAPTGLGSGTAKLQGQVRDDIRDFDQRSLGDTLMRQLVAQFLFINGLRGAIVITWGGVSITQAASIADLVSKLYSAGIQLAPNSLAKLGEDVGYELERRPAPASPFGFPPDGGTPNAHSARFQLTDSLTHRSTNSHNAATRAETVIERIAADRAADLAPSLAQVGREIRAIILSSTSPGDLEQRLQTFASHRGWRRERIAEEMEIALQVFAASSPTATQQKSHAFDL